MTQAERGSAREIEPPEFPCVGTNAMNSYNISRATQGLVAYVKEWRAAERISGRAKIVIAHDTRHFSKDFAAAGRKSRGGERLRCLRLRWAAVDAGIVVRCSAICEASAGIVITASHNPPHDNGYKVYFDDGAQVVEPHASGIIAKVNAIESETYTPVPPNEQGQRSHELGTEIDEAYMERLETLILDPDLVRAAEIAADRLTRRSTARAASSSSRC